MKLFKLENSIYLYVPPGLTIQFHHSLMSIGMCFEILQVLQFIDTLVSYRKRCGAAYNL